MVSFLKSFPLLVASRTYAVFFLQIHQCAKSGGRAGLANFSNAKALTAPI